VPFDGVDFILTELYKRYGHVVPGYSDKLHQMYRAMIGRGITREKIKDKSGKEVIVRYLNIPVKWFEWLKNEYENVI
jgi:hypothetical protein